MVAHLMNTVVYFIYLSFFQHRNLSSDGVQECSHLNINYDLSKTVIFETAIYIKLCSNLYYTSRALRNKAL